MKRNIHIPEPLLKYKRLAILRNRPDSLVVQRVLGVSEIKDNTGVRLGSTAVGELLVKVNGSVERQASILLEVNVKSLEVSWGVDDSDVTGLDKVIGNNQVLLVGSDLDVVGSNSRLVLIRVIETLDVVQVANVQSGNVVGSSQGGIEVFTVLADVGARVCC